MHRRSCEVRLGLTAAAQRLCLISGKPECAAGILLADPGTFPHSTTKRADVEVGLPTPYGSPQKRRESVGRAVHCAPELVMQTRLLGWNPAVHALTSAAAARAPPGRSSNSARCRPV